VKVFKFGGASVANAPAVRNVAEIIAEYSDNLVVVISAMGKTTNLLETLTTAYFTGSVEMYDIFDQFKKWHLEISIALFGGDSFPAHTQSLIDELGEKLKKDPSLNYDFEYDQIVGYGELVSTSLVSKWLFTAGIDNKWIDVRTCLRTDDNYRDAEIDWTLSERLAKKVFSFSDCRIYLTQGFIGSTISNLTTTLGREGSDFTAAILGNILDAEYVAIWKDVPGILNADPRIFKNATMIGELSYREAVEMSYSGAKVIHPKTIKPLHNKNIPLLVKSFVSPGDPGTIIHRIDHSLELIPVFIQKENQVLVTLSPKDFSFIDFGSISAVFNLFRKHRVKVNLIQQSAIDFSLVFDFPESGLESIIGSLSNNYETKYNTGLRLITIRYPNEKATDDIRKSGKVYLEQSSRRTTRIVLK
jgi:aspartate kinase